MQTFDSQVSRGPFRISILRCPEVALAFRLEVSRGRIRISTLRRAEVGLECRLGGLRCEGRTPRRATPLPESRASARRRENTSLESSQSGRANRGEGEF